MVATSPVLTSTVLVLAGVLLRGAGVPLAQGEPAVGVDDSSIAGIVQSGRDHREGGVWVIAETKSLPTTFRRIVVTDDRGRFVVPDLPEGSYNVWVRGYGLRDSVPVHATRGQRLNLAVVPAETVQEAARLYPANYWLSLYEPPPVAPEGFSGPDHWVANMKLGCIRCHQFGSAAFRQATTPDRWDQVWARRPNEARTADWLGRSALNGSLARWAAKIDLGLVPPPPPRPIGIERNVVISQWEWGRTDSYLHDAISTDKRNPTLYPDGRVWGVDFGQDLLWALDPIRHRVSSYKVPSDNVLTTQAGPYHNPANPHVPTLDNAGRVWIASQTRRERLEDRPRWAAAVIVNVHPRHDMRVETPAAWDEGSHHRQLVYFDTRQERFVSIDTAFGTNHLQFDREGRLWTSGDSVGLGMFDPSRFDPGQARETTPRAQKAFVSIDVETGRSLAGGGYGITVNPLDGTIWRTNTYIGGSGGPDADPGNAFVGENRIIAFNPKTDSFKDYVLPPPARGPVGIDAATDGTLWFGTGSGHLGRFDPKTERFTYWESPGPKLKGSGGKTGSADFHYSIFVDQWNTSGLGRNIVILSGTNSDALLAFDPRTERFTVIRVPYPLGMYQRGLDGRIDNADAGWKGRGLWITYANDPIKLVETGIGCINHIQVRPNPLAY
jgi:streptogramin lyase